MTETMKIRALAPWFGAGRTIAAAVGEALRGCKWVGIPFAGGMSELACIDARTLVVCDAHRHIVNLANVVATQRRALCDVLRRLPFHPDILRTAQEFCREHQPDGIHDLKAATHYFVCCWMGRSHKAGTTEEFNGGISRRWNSNGGDSNARYRSAVRSLAEWERIMQRCSFDTLDCFEFLDQARDEPGHGLYIDPPWPDDGKKYRHTFTTQQHERLAEKLAAFRHVRVVIRFGVHPLIERLYPESRWMWHEMTGRTQTNESKREVLILSHAKEGRLFD